MATCKDKGASALSTSLAMTNEVARAVHAGHTWAEIAAALDAGERTVRNLYRPRIASRIIRWLGDDTHGTMDRYWQARHAEPCYPDGRTCDPCLAVHADYLRRRRRESQGRAGLRTDPATVRRVAEQLHAGATWDGLAAEADRTLGYYRDTYRDLVQADCLVLAARDIPLDRGRVHGTKTAYTHGPCRCEPCTYSIVVYETERTRRKRRGMEPYADATKAREHVAWLQSQGMGWKRVALQAGLNPSVVWKLIYGDRKRGSGPSKRIRASTGRKIMAVQPSQIADGAVVDGLACRGQVAALRDAGWTWRAIGDRIGMHASNACRLAKAERVLAGTARAVRDLFRTQLQPPADAVRQPGGPAKAKAERERRSEAEGSAVAEQDLLLQEAS